jgi:polar amino acid transport system substrate-binding protein
VTENGVGGAGSFQSIEKTPREDLKMRSKITLLLFLFLIASPAWAAEVKEVRFMCENIEQFPVYMGNSDSIDWSNPGAGVECVKLLERKLGIKVTVERAPWKRVLDVELKNGTIDGAFSASYKKEREALGAYPMKGGNVDKTRSLHKDSYFFYKLKGSKFGWNGKAVSNLKGVVGAPNGYSVIDDLKKLGLSVEESNGTLMDFNKLAAGRVGVVAALELTADLLLKKSPDLNKVIVKVATPITSKEYYVMLSNQFVKSNPILAEKIWDAIGGMRKNEFPKLVRDKYLR